MNFNSPIGAKYMGFRDMCINIARANALKFVCFLLTPTTLKGAITGRSYSQSTTQFTLLFKEGREVKK